MRIDILHLSLLWSTICLSRSGREPRREFPTRRRRRRHHHYYQQQQYNRSSIIQLIVYFCRSQLFGFAIVDVT